jgi:hypothetical protein
VLTADFSYPMQMKQFEGRAFRDPVLVWREAGKRMSAIGNELLFNDSRYRSLTEAWCALVCSEWGILSARGASALSP